MSEKTVIKQFFQFDKHIFPPASAPIRRGMVIGLFVSLAVVSVMLLIAYSYPIRQAEDVFKLQFRIALMAGLAGFPWIVLFSFGPVGLVVPTLMNGVFLGFVIGVIVKKRRLGSSKRDAVALSIAALTWLVLSVVNVVLVLSMR